VDVSWHVTVYDLGQNLFIQSLCTVFFNYYYLFFLIEFTNVDFHLDFYIFLFSIILVILLFQF